MKRNLWRAAFETRKGPGGTSGIGGTRFRPQVERLEDRAAPSDSLRSVWYNFSDLVPAEALVPPTTRTGQVTLANLALQPAQPEASLPLDSWIQETDPALATGPEAALALDHPPVAMTQNDRDVVVVDNPIPPGPLPFDRRFDGKGDSSGGAPSNPPTLTPLPPTSARSQGNIVPPIGPPGVITAPVESPPVTIVLPIEVSPPMTIVSPIGPPRITVPPLAPPGTIVLPILPPIEVSPPGSSDPT